MLRTHFSHSIPLGLRESILVDSYGLPRYWATVWSSLSLGHLSHNTRLMKLRYVEDAYLFADELLGFGALDDALGFQNVEKVAGILEGFFISLRNKATRTTSDEARWRTVYDFVSSVLSWQSRGGLHGALSETSKKLRHLNGLYKQLHVQSSKRQEMLRALPANVVEVLYEMLDPTSSTNPFKREKTRWMMFVIFIVLLHQGLRRGELLLQPVNAVKNGDDLKQGRIRYWLNVADQNDKYDDTRASRPSIKTHFGANPPAGSSAAPESAIHH